MKRVFKTKTFDRWTRKVVSDSLLCQAAREIEQGLFEADLGGGLCKKRVPLPGRGKSGSTRILVAKKHKAAIFFLAGREKMRRALIFPTRKSMPQKSSPLRWSARIARQSTRSLPMES